MLDHALPHFEGEVEAGETGVAQFEILHDVESVEIVIEVEGPDEESMAIRLKELFETHFDFVREE